MIDLKKIADGLRVIREAYAPLVRTNTVCDGLTAIIDELDPPEPQPEPAPQYKVGDWVTNGRVVGRVTLIKPEWIDILDQHGIPHTLGLVNLHKLDPSEVRVKVVLEGTVSQDSILDKASCFSLHTDRSEHIISLSEIEDSELVESLLKAQEEKC